MIWTTTPWTLPANQAVALHAEIEYQLVQVTTERGKQNFILAKDLDLLLQLSVTSLKTQLF